MQIVNIIIYLLSFCFNLSFINRDVNLNNAYLSFNNCYFLHFDPINEELDKVEVSVNGNKLIEYQQIINLSIIKLDLLEENKMNNIDILIIENNERFLFNLTINLQNKYVISDSGSFSFNDLIVDVNNISLKKVEQFKLYNYFYEIKGDYHFLDVSNFFYLQFNSKIIFFSSIELIVYNEDVFEFLNYNNGYHFILNMVNENDMFYLKYEKVSDDSINYEAINNLDNKNQIYFCPTFEEEIIDCEIIFSDICNSKIDIYVPQIVNINNHLLINGNRYQLNIKDLQEFDQEDL